MIIIAFLKAPDWRIVERLDDTLRRRRRIRCPACGWEPGAQDRWCCSPGCGHVWNTFDTRGVCPACDKHWTHTACLRCHAWSEHDAWYDEDEEDQSRTG